MPAKRTPPHLLTLILLSGLSPLSLNMFMPALANMAVDLQTDYGTISLVVSGSLAVTALIQLVVGPLSDWYGRRPVLLLAMASFACASVGCLLARDVTSFLIFRILQGGVTAGYTLSLAIVRDTRSEREAVSLIGYIGMSMAIAPILGPILGGVLDSALGWRAIFAVYAFCGFSLFALCWLDLGETRPKPTAAADTGPARATELLLIPLFWACALCGAFSVGAFYIFLTGAPLVAQKVFGISSAALGFYVASITVGFMTGGFLAGRLGPLMAPTTLMVSGRVIACTGPAAGLCLLVLGLHHPFSYFACTVFVGLGNGLTVPATNTVAMSIRPELAGSAAGWGAASIMAIGALLTALTGQLITATNAAHILLFLMLASTFLSLISGLLAHHLSRHSR